MREILITNRFKKDLKKAKKNPRQDSDKLLLAIETLAIHGVLSEDYIPHCLSGNWKPKWECHIQPNFLLIYGNFSLSTGTLFFSDLQRLKSAKFHV